LGIRENIQEVREKVAEAARRAERPAAPVVTRVLSTWWP